MGPEAAQRLSELPPMWIMVAGPYRSGAATAEARARNLAALNQAAARFRARGRPVYAAIEEVPASR